MHWLLVATRRQLSSGSVKTSRLVRTKQQSIAIQAESVAGVGTATDSYGILRCLSADVQTTYPRGFPRQSLRINESPVHAFYRKLDRLAPDEDRHSALEGE